MTKNRKLKLLEKTYDSLYDLNSIINYRYNHILEELEKEAKNYGYEFKINNYDTFKLYKIKKKEVL